MSFSAALRLGRVSNVPTVWSNVLAGTVLAGADPWTWATLAVALAVTSFYVGGMYLNDAFDRDIDARERAARPIPAGEVAANTVFAAGFFMILGGILVVALTTAIASPETTARAVVASVALGAAILFYDWHHKGNPLSPVSMGLCRVLAYVTAGYAAVTFPASDLWIGALVCLSYLVGLTYAAKQETLDKIGNLWPLFFLLAPIFCAMTNIAGLTWFGWAIIVGLVAWLGLALRYLMRRQKGDVPRAVTSLIAGISLVDAMFLSLAGSSSAAIAALICFALTRLLQEWISGT